MAAQQTPAATSFGMTNPRDFLALLECGHSVDIVFMDGQVERFSVTSVNDYILNVTSVSGVSFSIDTDRTNTHFRINGFGLGTVRVYSLHTVTSKSIPEAFPVSAAAR